MVIVHLADAAADRIDHLESHHSRYQKLISVSLLRSIADEYPFDIAGNKRTLVREDQFVVVFHYVDLTAERIILMGDCIVQCLADDIRFIRVDLFGEERLVLRIDVAVFQIANLVVYSINSQNERAGGDHVIALDIIRSAQNPFDFGDCRRDQVLTLLSAEQHDGCIGNLSPNRNLCLVQKSRVIP